MESIAEPTRMPRETSLGNIQGITNDTRMNRLGRVAIITCPIILKISVKAVNRYIQ